MLICRLLSFSLFMYSCLLPIPGYCSKLKGLESEMLLLNPTEVKQDIKLNGVLLDTNKEITPAEEAPVELDNSCDDFGPKDGNVSQIVDAFVLHIEGFWQETKRNLDEYRKRKLPPGQWWLKEVGKDYRSMKEIFFSGLSPDTPQECLEILADYEVRYNEIMWQELEKEIRRIQSYGESEEEEDNEVTYKESPRCQPLTNAEESLDDAYYSSIQNKGSNLNPDDENSDALKGISKKPTFFGVLYKEEDNITPLYCGEQIPITQRAADS